MDGRRQQNGGHGGISRAMDGGDPRTPMAWQHRDISYGGGYDNYGGDHARPPPSPSRYSNRYAPPVGATTPSVSSRRERGHSADRYSNRSRGTKGSRGTRGTRSYRNQSPSSTDGTAEETTETDSQPTERDSRTDYNHHMLPGYPVMMAGYPVLPAHMQVPMMYPGTGSIRSVQSVPILSAGAPPAHTWDGEPCPVHHQHEPMVPLAALYGLGHHPGLGYPGPLSLGHASVPASVISGATTVRRARSVAELSQHGLPYSQPPTPGRTLESRKKFHTSQASIGGVSYLQPHPHRLAGSDRLVLAEDGTPSQLPIRREKNTKIISPIPVKAGEKSGFDFCSGYFIILWIILGVVTFGVCLGIILRFTLSSSPGTSA